MQDPLMIFSIADALQRWQGVLRIIDILQWWQFIVEGRGEMLWSKCMYRCIAKEQKAVSAFKQGSPLCQIHSLQAAPEHQPIVATCFEKVLGTRYTTFQQQEPLCTLDILTILRRRWVLPLQAVPDFSPAHCSK